MPQYTITIEAPGPDSVLLPPMPVPLPFFIQNNGPRPLMIYGTPKGLVELPAGKRWTYRPKKARKKRK